MITKVRTRRRKFQLSEMNSELREMKFGLREMNFGLRELKFGLREINLSCEVLDSQSHRTSSCNLFIIKQINFKALIILIFLP